MFVGDSITSSWPSDLQPEGSLNRGIGGDFSGRLVTRTWLIIQERPDVIYLMIGTNDLQRHRALEQTLSDVEWILDEITFSLPDVIIYLLSVPPCRPASIQSALDLNHGLETLASYFPSIAFVDIFNLFYEDGKIINTLDGIHPTRQGYVLLKEELGF